MSTSILLGLSCDGRNPSPLHVSVAPLSLDCPQQMRALLRVPSQNIDCPLTRDGEDFSGSCKVAADSDVLGIELEYWSVRPEHLLAQAQKEITLGTDTDTVSFTKDDLVYPDPDADGVNTLDELCFGLDPDIEDAPQFTAISHERDTIGAKLQRFTIAERVRINGVRIPAAAPVKISIGPLLDAADTELTPLSVAPTEVVAQLPPGLDTAGNVTLTVELFGNRWTQQLPVARVWGASARGEHTGLFLFAHGDYGAPPGPLEDHFVALPGTCTSGTCTPQIWSMTADGRQLLMYMNRDRKGELLVVDIPTGTPWPNPTSWPQDSSFALVEKDGYLAALDPSTATIQTHRFDAKARQIGATAQDQVTVPDAALLAAKDDRLFVYSETATSTTIRRYLVEQGRLNYGGSELSLPDQCSSANCYRVRMLAVDTHRLLLSRANLNQVDLIDFDTRQVASATIPRPYDLALAPRSRNRVAVASLRFGELYDAVDLCLLSLDAFESQPAGCTFTGTGGPPTSVAIVPEESEILVTSGVFGEIRTFKLSADLPPLERISLNDATHSIVLQP